MNFLAVTSSVWMRPVFIVGACGIRYMQTFNAAKQAPGLNLPSAASMIPSLPVILSETRGCGAQTGRLS